MPESLNDRDRRHPQLAPARRDLRPLVREPAWMPDVIARYGLTPPAR